MNKNILLASKTADKATRLEFGFTSKVSFLAAQKEAWQKRHTREAAKRPRHLPDLVERLARYKNDRADLTQLNGSLGIHESFYYLRRYSNHSTVCFNRFATKIERGSKWIETSSCKKYGAHNSEFNFMAIPLNYPSSCVQVIAGVVTVFDPTGRAYWLVPSKGYSSKLVSGWIIEDDERQVHVASDKSRLACLVKFLKTKARKEKKLALINKFKNNFDVLRWVTVADSLRAGNCAEGTRAFIERSGLSKLGAVRSDYLLELCNDPYTRTAIRFSTRFV